MCIYHPRAGGEGTETPQAGWLVSLCSQQAPGSLSDSIKKRKQVEINRGRHQMLTSAISMQACAAPHPHVYTRAHTHA